MVLSFSKNFLGIKTRKTASSSIEVGLSNICDDGDILSNGVKNRGKMNYHISPSNNFGLRPHSEIGKIKKEFIGKGIINEDDGKMLLKFTIERNPGDKVVSLGKYQDSKRKTKRTFNEYMKDGRWGLCYNWPLYTIDDKIEVNYTMKGENIENEINGISHILDSTIKIGFENTNIRDDKEYRKFYNKENKQKIENYFKNEIEHFNYIF